MASLNKATLIGRLTRDPEVRSMNNGGEVVSFSLATSETWKDKASGERKEKAEFHNIVIFNEGLGRIAKQYLRKGSQCYVEGQLQTRKWTDQSGNDKYTTEVVLQKFRGELVLLDSKPAENGQNRDNADTGSAGQSAWDQHDLDDDVPFISPFIHHERRVG